MKKIITFIYVEIIANVSFWIFWDKITTCYINRFYKYSDMKRQFSVLYYAQKPGCINILIIVASVRSEYRFCVYF